MIQRIQTILLLLATLGAVFLFISAQDVVLWDTQVVMTLPCIALVLLGCWSIFSFKNRKRQLLLNTISIGINALLIILLLYWLQSLSGGIHFPEKGIEPLFPFISVVCLLLANIYIRRDERLVKSVDRLR